ncbi:MAG TPA: L,D-transpeptidase [Candidatus Solibacter sp.]|nr:L,D-transpeptidase [Candidatus Solibacter sp.]
MGQALSIPEPGTRLPDERTPERVRRLLSRRVVVRMVLTAMIVAGLVFAFLYQTQTEVERLGVVSAAQGEALAAYQADANDGMTASQLSADKRSLDQLNSAATPLRFFLVDFQRMDFWSRQQRAYRDLAQQLQASRADLLTKLRQQVSASVAVASQVADAWRQAGGTPADVDTLAGGTDKLAADSQVAGKVSELNAINQKIEALVIALQAGLAQQNKDNATQATHAAEELPLATSDLTAAHKRADDLRDDALGTADAATHYNIGGADRLTARITRDAASADAATTPAALAAAIGWLRTDTDRLQSAMAAGMPDKAIYVSTARQEMRSFEHGVLVKQSLVTTGRPELPTDIGTFSVLRKNHPWTMHSPFPRSSPYWYPDTVVQYVLWFNDDGSGLHDAYWRSKFGPGTNGPGRSGGTHGCINMPTDVTIWMYDWAPVGTPVVVG